MRNELLPPKANYARATSTPNDNNLSMVDHTCSPIPLYFSIFVCP